MLEHRPATQTRCAQLFEAAATFETDLVGELGNGLAVEREVRSRTYLDWQLRGLDGRQRRVYLGPAADATALSLRDALVRRKAQRALILEDLERLAAA